MKNILLVFGLVLSVLSVCLSAEARTDRPNVVIVITDDQGYGDLAAHGNKIIQTPKMDRLRDESVRFTQFHVDPTCAPTRAALMTGRYATRVGVWHTVLGRSILRRQEIVMPELFAEAGYRTGMFGKWHLGDNYPYRPHDRGFHEAFYHHGGGLCQSADYWSNDYFDDTYYRNGVPEKATGYCTDVWFDNAIEFVKRNHEKPFFLYVATNAPHRPLHVDEKYWKPYAEKGVPEHLARFYGMITNIDENVDRAGKYRFRLRTYPEESQKSSNVTHAALGIGDRRLSKTFEPGTNVQEVVFDVELDAGPAWIATELDDRTRGIYRAAFYVYVERLE